MVADTEKREAVGLTEEKRQATIRLIETFNLIENETDRRVGLAYLEGLAAAQTTPPQATA